VGSPENIGEAAATRADWIRLETSGVSTIRDCGDLESVLTPAIFESDPICSRGRGFADIFR